MTTKRESFDLGPLTFDGAFCDGSEMLGGHLAGPRRADVKEMLKIHDDTLCGLHAAAVAREQLNPIQQLLVGGVLSLFGAPGATTVLTDALCRAGHGSVGTLDLGSILEPPRGLVGREDARAGRPPEAPDAGYLAGYCDAVIEMERRKPRAKRARRSR